MHNLRPDDISFTPVQPKLTAARLLAAASLLVVVAIASAVAAVLVSGWLWILFGIPVALILWLLWLIPRQVRALAWAITPDSLVVTRGVMFQQVTVIPLGRLQYTEVERGPILNIFGLARLELHTASATTDGSVSGLTYADAKELQKRLTAGGEAHLMGL